MLMRAPLLALLALPAVVAGPAAGATLDALVRTAAGKPLPDAAVVLEPFAPAAAPKNRARAAVQVPHTQIEQRGAEFSPWVTVVQAGTAVDFPNNDTVRHHVYSFSQPKRFEIKLYAGKPGQPITFDKPGEVVIGCNIHDWMEAYVLVVESPYFGKTGPDGQVHIGNLPAGVCTSASRVAAPAGATTSAGSTSNARSIDFGARMVIVRLTGRAASLGRSARPRWSGRRRGRSAHARP